MSLDVWPALPLVIEGCVSEMSMNNVIAELKHGDRIYKIDLKSSTNLRIETLWTAMQVSFPELTDLSLSLKVLLYVPVLPDSFLGGSAPRLLSLLLNIIPFPRLPKLALSTTRLVEPRLIQIPHSGYFSPEAMTTCLSVLTSLKSLQLQFESSQSCPDQESQRSPPTRFILSALYYFSFKEVNEYLEDLVSQIDAPRLFQLWTELFNDIDYDTLELNQFITRTPIFI